MGGSLPGVTPPVHSCASYTIFTRGVHLTLDLDYYRFHLLILIINSYSLMSLKILYLHRYCKFELIINLYLCVS